ncbi:SDR family NAD(P)-dependent oxidoreductase [Chelatococcus asaccharovorans]|uniref:SDR family NAD(P)-dependent oxidoreductase n=1 Tax=Chelatococcus asaccharovorans TaxID=28210 RepID=UPI00224C760E|nr:SDR family oxidoreductase [Chelatococcus asaccharovorans]CAH1651931.1 3-oxoacyl-(acyl-carrier protein) reductase [Chelatococcus asaccharovorans]CAH1686483.1 3-oxoacyl-(acyl-carrier protein) reductase [Chelatococcus asaccharovorans]
MNEGGVPPLAVPEVSLVTGASSGIGMATALRLAAMGSAVVVGYNSRAAAAEAVVRSLHGGGHRALRIAIDDTASIDAAAAAVEREYGRLDALVNCGGATTPVPANDLAGLTDEIFDRTVAVNLRGPFAVVRAFRPLLERGSGASIVNISSIAARTGLGSSLAYLAAKAGVDALTVALAKVLAPDIRVFSVSPAGVDTDFVPGRTREHLQKTAEKLPLAHITGPDDVARAVVACIVNLTSSTGIVVPVDEGRHL